MLRSLFSRPTTMAASAIFCLQLIAGAVGGEAADNGVIRNPGFESGTLKDWEITRYGAPSAVTLAGDSKHEGSQSVRIAASAASDTAVAQEVTLKPSAWYRLAGWVRTRGLDPLGAPTFGTIQVQHSHGRATIAAGPNHGGDTD